VECHAISDPMRRTDKEVKIGLSAVIVIAGGGGGGGKNKVGEPIV